MKNWTRRLTLGTRQQAARQQAVLLAQSRLHDGMGRLPAVGDCIDPGALGVHPAALPAGHSAGHSAGQWAAPGPVPPYVPRDADENALLAEGFASGGLVIIEGASAAGKTRLAYQAMHRSAPARQLVVPDGPAALRELAAAGVQLADSIVWLDNINDYLAAGGLDAGVLDALCPDGCRDVLLLATMRSEARRLLADAALDGTVRRAAQEIIARARVIPLSRAFSDAERQRALQRSAADPRLADALDQPTGAGFAEYLAAAPAILRRWQSAPDSTSRAIITAAVDARRAGILTPLPRELLHDLRACYVDPGLAQVSGDRSFDDALTWASEPVHGASGCLGTLGAGTYQPFDYLLDHAQAAGSSVPAAAWPVLLTYARPVDLCSLAMAAYAAGQPDISETAFRRAADAGHASALCDLGVLLEQAGRRQDAERWFQRAADAGNASAMGHLGVLAEQAGGRPDAESWYRMAGRAGDTGSMYHLGMLLEQEGRREEAEQWYRRAADAKHGRAMTNLGALLQEGGRAAEAEQWYRQAAAAGDARSVNNLGALLHEAGRTAEAERCYRQSAATGHAGAINNLAIVLHEAGRAAEAEPWYRQAAATGDSGAMYNLGVLAEQAGPGEEAERWYRQSAGAGHIRAMNNLGALLDQAGHQEEAERWYRQAADAGHPGARYNLGVLLDERGGRDEAERYYRQAADAGHTGAMARLGALLQERGEHEEAARWYRQADTETPRQVTAKAARRPAGG